MRKPMPQLTLHRETLRCLTAAARSFQAETDGDSCVLSCTPTCHDCQAVR